MKKLKGFFLGVISTLIVMLGVFSFNFYLTHPFGIVSVLVGIFGFLILYPAVKKWEQLLSGSDANQK